MKKLKLALKRFLDIFIFVCLPLIAIFYEGQYKIDVLFVTYFSQAFNVLLALAFFVFSVMCKPGTANTVINYYRSTKTILSYIPQVILVCVALTALYYDMYLLSAMVFTPVWLSLLSQRILTYKAMLND